MNKLISLFTLLAFTSFAFGASTSTIEATNTEGFFSSQNLIRDAGFEGQNKGGAWTKSGGTLTSSSTTPIRGSFSGVWASSAAAQTLKSKLVAIPAGLYGVNGVLSCRFKAATGTATHTLTVSDGTNDLATAVTITSSTTIAPRTSVNFVFPSSGSIQYKMTSVSASEPSLTFDDCYLGSADGFNLGSLSQATFVGSIKWAPTASCSWITNNTSWGNLANVSACAGTARTILGNVTDASVGLRPAVGITNAGPGRYSFVAHGGFYKQNTSNSRCDYRFSDGTNVSNSGGISSNSAESQGPVFSGGISYTSAPGNLTVDIQVFAASVSNCSIDASANGLEIEVYKFPTTAETIYRGDQVGASWSGSITGVGGGWQTASTVYTDLSVATTSSTATTISSRNMTCVAEATKLAGITCTIPRAGLYEVSAGLAAGTLTAAVGFGDRLVDGSGFVLHPGLLGTGYGSTSTQGLTLTGQYLAAAAGSVTFKINGLTLNASDSHFLNQSFISWSVKSIDGSIPAPVFVGSVTSGSSGAMRHESVGFGGNSSYTACTTGACTLIGNYTGWVTSITWNSGGNYSVVIPAGTFSAPPICSCTANAVSTATAACAINSVPTTTGFLLLGTASGGTVLNIAGEIACDGPR